MHKEILIFDLKNLTNCFYFFHFFLKFHYENLILREIYLHDNAYVNSEVTLYLLDIKYKYLACLIITFNKTYLLKLFTFLPLLKGKYIPLQ